LSLPLYHVVKSPERCSGLRLLTNPVDFRRGFVFEAVA
jgi:hypothetical protein